MTRHHIGEKTNDQGKGLDEYAQELHRHQDEFNPQWYSRGIENMPPVMRIGAEHNHHKRDQAQYRGKSDITCYVGRTGDQPKNIIDKDEKALAYPLPYL